MDARSTTSRRLAVVVMGVSGSGKSTVGAGLAAALGLPFIDGDSLHAPESVARMRAGIALGDDDRWPWLDRIGARLGDGAAAPAGIVVACSALKRAYRDRIRAAAQGMRFVYLEGTQALLEARLAGRSGHYMPGSLLASQLATLEPPGEGEGDAVRVGIDAAPAEIVACAVRALRAESR